MKGASKITINKHLLTNSSKGDGINHDFSVGMS